jgi:ABC-type glycerol-3-phosphate transport system substrate-binding protein
MEPAVTASPSRKDKKASLRHWKRLTPAFIGLLVMGAGAVLVWNWYFHSDLQPGMSPGNTLAEPEEITILIRMMEPHENWFVRTIVREFEVKNNCRVLVKRFHNDYELVEILEKSEKERLRNGVSLVKTPLHLTLLLYKSGLLIPYEDILRNLNLNRSEITSWMAKVQDEYDPVALKMSVFSTITGAKLYFLPRKLETRLMVFRKSRVTDAIENWPKLRSQVDDLLKRENGYGLPRNYDLESDTTQWDFYDLLVIGYYWANTQYNGKTAGRVAHRSKDYSGTVIGLIDKALQLGALDEDIRQMSNTSEAIVDLFHWQAIFRKYGLYCEAMWNDDGWYGYDLYRGIENEDVFLTWMHQLDCMLVCGSDELGIEGYLDNREDLGISVMPQGVSFELTSDGQVKRVGTREAHTFGWFWGIPKHSPKPEIAYKLAMFLTSHECQLKELEAFSIIPVKKGVTQGLRTVEQPKWRRDLRSRSMEQLKLNRSKCVPRFKTLAGYNKFLRDYCETFKEIVINKRYSQQGPQDRVRRSFIRESMKR